jgi:hypothetical protein
LTNIDEQLPLQQPLPLPDHLRGRAVFKHSPTHRLTHLYIQAHPKNYTGEEAMRCGVLDDWWPQFTPARQHAMLMLSITPQDTTLEPTDVALCQEDARMQLYADGDMRVEI